MKKTALPLLSLTFLLPALGLSSCGGNSSSSSTPQSQENSEKASEPQSNSQKEVKSEEESKESVVSSKHSERMSSSEESLPESQTEPFVFPTVDTPVLKEDGDYSYTPIMEETLPTIDIVSDDGSTDFVTVPSRGNKWDYTECKVSVSGSEDKYLLSDIKAGVKVRGNYTSNYDKKPLRIKFDKKQAMLGLNNGNKMKSWVLLAEVKDSSLLRNTAAFYLGKKILGSDGYYVSDFRPVNVRINGEYWGVYILAEQQQVNASRVNITEPEDDTVTNDIGYLVEYDGYYTEETGPDADPTFTLNYNNNATLTGPNGSRVRPGNKGYTIKSDIMVDSQREFAGQYLENVYRVALNAKSGKYYDISPNGLDLVSAQASSMRDHIGKYIDLNSMVDTYLVQEITCDPDIGWSSFYMDFDMGPGKDHRLRFEAPWDYDSALGNRSGYCEDAKGYYAYGSSNPWLTLLTGEPFFVSMVKAKWEKLKNEGAFADVFNVLHEYSDRYESEYTHNFQRWHHLGGSYDGTSGELREETKTVFSQSDAANFMMDWLGDRLTYLSGVYGKGDDLHCPRISKETIPEGCRKQRYEAESATLYGGATQGEDNLASSKGYVGFPSGKTTCGVRFSVNVEKDTEAYFVYGIGRQINSRDPQEMFELKIGSESIAFPERRNAQGSNPKNAPKQWGTVNMGKITLKEGENVLTVRSRGCSTNLDYIDLHFLPQDNPGQ